MESPSLEQMMPPLILSAVRAGAVIADIWSGPFDVEAKDDNSPVTVADQRAEEIILKDLAALAPDIPVLAEEAVSAGNIPQTGRRFFLVDPLDGTREFINRRKEFTVNIALVEDGEPVAGVIFTPLLDRLYYAFGPGQSWTCKGSDVSPADPLCRSARRKLSTRTPDPGGLTVMTSKSHLTPETERYLSTMKVSTSYGIGSSLKFCELADARADVYPRLGRTMEWDTGAGQAILVCAGGVVLTLDGEPLRYGKIERGYDNPHFVAWGRAPAE